jgi:proline dehydrogenase
MIEHLDKMSIFAGTYNEQSSYTLMSLMKEMGIKNNDNRI